MIQQLPELSFCPWGARALCPLLRVLRQSLSPSPRRDQNSAVLAQLQGRVTKHDAQETGHLPCWWHFFWPCPCPWDPHFRTGEIWLINPDQTTGFFDSQVNHTQLGCSVRNLLVCSLPPEGVSEEFRCKQITSLGRTIGTQLLLGSVLNHISVMKSKNGSKSSTETKSTVN